MTYERPRRDTRDDRADRPAAIDRSRTTPFLVRLFVGSTAHFPDNAYTSTSTPPLSSAVDLYTWKDSTLNDLVLLLQSARASPAGTVRYSLKHVYYESQLDEYGSKELGIVNSRDLTKPFGDLRGSAAAKSLADVNFIVGDYIDVAYLQFAPEGVREDRNAGAGRGRLIAPLGGAFGSRGGFGGSRGEGGQWSRGGGSANLSNGRPQIGDPDSSWPGEKDGNARAAPMDEDKPPRFEDTARGRQLAQSGALGKAPVPDADDGPWGSGAGAVSAERKEDSQPSPWD